MIVVWPDRILLGVLGRRTEPASIVWAFRLAERWDARVRVVGGYHPPVGMFPHIVTAAECEDRRRAGLAALTAQLETATASEHVRIPPRAARLTVVPDRQLEHALLLRSHEADLMLLSLPPAGTLLAGRQHARGRRVAARAGCPTSTGPGRAGASLEVGFSQQEA